MHVSTEHTHTHSKLQTENGQKADTIWGGSDEWRTNEMQFGFLLMKTISNSSWLSTVVLHSAPIPIPVFSEHSYIHFTVFCHLTCYFLLASGGIGGSRGQSNRKWLSIASWLTPSTSSSTYKNAILLHKYSLIICNYVIEEVINVFVRSNRILSACD